MKQTLTFLACLITTLCSAQTKWEKVEITPNLFVSFPAQPIKSEPANGQKTFILRSADSTANYIVAATDLGILMGIDEATLSAEMEKEESWEQAKSATLVKSEMTTRQGNKALKLIIERKNEKGAINTLTAFIFVKGTTTHNVMFNNRGGLADEKMKQQFFESVEIK
jgi:GTPase